MREQEKSWRAWFDEENIEPLRFHDLRATFTTWARRAQRPDAWIAERTGHQTQEMIDRYARAAQTLADLRYEPFPEISGAIPELDPLSPALSPPASVPTDESPETSTILATSMVGASGFEPPTPRPPV